MKFYTLIFRVVRPAIVPLLAVALFAGCRILPDTHFASPSIVGQAQGNHGGTAPAVPTVALSSASSAMQQTANSLAHWAWVGGLVCAVLAGLCGYGGQIIPCVKLSIASVVLFFGGTWFAWHWREFFALALCASAIGFLWAERKSSVEQRIWETMKGVKVKL